MAKSDGNSAETPETQDNKKDNKIELIHQFIESAEVAIKNARQHLAELTGLDGKQSKKKEAVAPVKARDLKTSEGGKIIEGVFDGQNMIGPDGKQYPVPANYASKSKLVQGDILKLTISEDGTFIYKQISPTPRKKLIGTLVYEDGEYKVIAGGKAFNVLFASVTYFKANQNDQVAIVVPDTDDGNWAAIENVIDVPTK